MYVRVNAGDKQECLSRSAKEGKARRFRGEKSRGISASFSRR